MTADLAARLRRCRDWLCDVLDRQSQRLRTRAEVMRLGTLAVRAEHPYAEEIMAFRKSGGNLFLNCSVQGRTFDDHPLPDGEVGYQCDAIPDGVRPLAIDDRYVYCDDGERYPTRPPRSARRG